MGASKPSYNRPASRARGILGLVALARLQYFKLGEPSRHLPRGRDPPSDEFDPTGDWSGAVDDA